MSTGYGQIYPHGTQVFACPAKAKVEIGFVKHLLSPMIVQLIKSKNEH